MYSPTLNAPTQPPCSSKELCPWKKRSERSKRLRILSRKKKEHFYRQFEGQEVEVLFEDSENEGMIQGYSENYLRVELPFDAKLANQSIKLKLAELNSDLRLLITLFPKL